MHAAWIWTLGVVGLALGWVTWVFNRLVRARYRMKEGWSGVEVQLRLRHNLVPNLVSVVRAYAAHEQQTLEDVVRARSEVPTVEGVRHVASAETDLTGRLVPVLALAEAYPDLKADHHFLQLQRELVKIEDQIQMARRYYNGTVRDYNTLVESFPSNVVAAVAGHEPGPFFEIECATERAVPRVALGGAAESKP